jgi:hypothetical protein
VPKTRAELEEIAQTEACVINLKKNVDDLEAQLNQQCEQNYGPMHASFNHTQQTPNNQAKR